MATFSTQAENNVPQLGFGFDVESLIDDNLTDSCIFAENPTFCSLFDDCNSSPVQVGKREEKSPFHESDSGVSDGTYLSPAREDCTTMFDDLDFDPFLIGSVDSDEDLASFIGGGDSSEKLNPKPANPPTPQVTEHQTRSKTGALKTSNRFPENGVQNATPRIILRPGKQASTATQSNADSDSDVDIVDSENTVKKPKGSVRITHPGSTLPSRPKSSDSESSTGCSVTSVKIVRIKNTGGAVNAGDEIARALDERNRKNAEMAKVNRQKKKVYIESLEKERDEEKERAASLEEKVKRVEEERDDLKTEVEYLKSVLANQSTLAGLLKNIPGTVGVSLSSSITRKRTAEMDHSYNAKKLRQSAAGSTSGICLHVDQNNVSLEFCHHCAQMAHDA